jgi:DNA-binding winged helix-turn-helix (wHTH) protein
VDAANAQAWQGKQLLTLRPRAFAVLRYLSEHPGQLVTKDEVIRAVWMDTVVTDDALVACVLELRKALQDEVQRPRYIETVHRRGYRFIGPVAAGAAPVSGSEFKVSSSPPSPASDRKKEKPSSSQPETWKLKLETCVVGRELGLAKLHLPLLLQFSIFRLEGVLNLDRAAHAINNTGELGQQIIAW